MEKFNGKNLKKFNKRQKQYIDIAKYYQGLKIGKDPGNEFCIDYIDKNGKKLRKTYCIEKLNQTIKDIDNALNKAKDKTEKSRLMVIKRNIEAIDFLMKNEKEDNGNGKNGKNGKETEKD